MRIWSPAGASVRTGIPNNGTDNANNGTDIPKNGTDVPKNGTDNPTSELGIIGQVRSARGARVPAVAYPDPPPRFPHDDGRARPVRTSPRPAPGLAHICAGTRHICPGTRIICAGTRSHLRRDSLTSAPGRAGTLRSIRSRRRPTLRRTTKTSSCALYFAFFQELCTAGARSVH